MTIAQLDQLSHLHRAILSFVASRRTVSTGEIAHDAYGADTKDAREAVRAALANLRLMGLVERRSDSIHNRYSATIRGRAAVDSAHV